MRWRNTSDFSMKNVRHTLWIIWLQNSIGSIMLIKWCIKYKVVSTFCWLVQFSTALDLCLLFCCFGVQSGTVSCSFWTSDVSPAALTSNLTRFLAPFGLLTCLPQLWRPNLTISLYLDALTPPIFKIIRAMPVFYYQHCSIRYIFSYSTLFSYTILIICSYINISLKS